jgi:hypothetical protein
VAARGLWLPIGNGFESALLAAAGQPIVMAACTNKRNAPSKSVVDILTKPDAITLALLQVERAQTISGLEPKPNSNYRSPTGRNNNWQSCFSIPLDGHPSTIQILVTIYSLKYFTAHHSIALWMVYRKSFRFDSIRRTARMQIPAEMERRQMARANPPTLFHVCRHTVRPIVPDSKETL